jgi:multisubunit Na+/H+ antiporter MnhE subunit
MKAFGMHLLVALVWLFLNGAATLGAFLMGLIAGFALLALFRRALRCESYVRRVCGAGAFALRMLLEIARANLRLTLLILGRKAGAIEGRFAYYDVTDLTPTETIIVAQCLSLTPGTTVAEYNAKGQLVLHTFPALSDEELKKEIDKTFKEPLLAFTR